MRLEDTVRSLDFWYNRKEPSAELWDPWAVVNILRESRQNEVPLYIAGRGAYLYGVAVPARLLRDEWLSDLLNHRGFGVPEHLGWCCVFNGSRTWGELSRPLDRSGSSILTKGTPLIVVRSAPRGSSYIEPNQVLAHSLSLHLDSARKHWETLNELGELVPRLRTLRDGGFVVTLDREGLDEYLALSSSVLVRVFEWFKWTGECPMSLSEPQDLFCPEDKIYSRVWSLDGAQRAIRVRGIDVISLDRKQKARAWARLRGDTPRLYEKFLVKDLRSEKLVEWVADPEKLGNYFVPSDFPHGLSAAFFKPEVLLQYRAEPERFTVHPTTVECKDAWDLPYDVNADGQVHVYLVDLAQLPHTEQLRWKVHNEKPKGGISKRAFIHDFRGEWTNDYDPLISLKQAASDFPKFDDEGSAFELWRTGPVAEELGYVLTNSAKDLQDQLLNLCKLVVEGLNAKAINGLAKKLGCHQPELASIKQLAGIMAHVKVDASDRDQITEALMKVQRLRSGQAAHRGALMLDDAKGEFRLLLGECDAALRCLAALVRKGAFTKPST